MIYIANKETFMRISAYTRFYEKIFNLQKLRSFTSQF